MSGPSTRIQRLSLLPRQQPPQLLGPVAPKLEVGRGDVDDVPHVEGAGEGLVVADLSGQGEGPVRQRAREEERKKAVAELRQITYVEVRW